LRRSLCQAAWAVTRKKNCYLSAQFKRPAAQRGVKRAVMAVAHTMLVIGYHVLKTAKATTNWEEIICRSTRFSFSGTS